MNILILTGRFGMGHCSAAKALEEEIRQKDPEANIYTVDVIDYFFPKIGRLIYGGFHLMVSKCSFIYNFLNYFTENYMQLPVGHGFVKKMERLLKKCDADVVAAMFPICSQYVSAYKEKMGSEVLLYTYITDISVHEEWIAKHTNLYFVGARRTAESLMARGVEKEKIRISGIPVRTCFKRTVSSNRWHVKKEVLIMGGGLGLIPFSDNLLDWLNGDPKVHVTVITGTNRKLKERLEEKYPSMQVLGYTENVDDYMRRADLIVTKAGGITTFEAIYCGMPMFVIRPFLEQELENAIYIEEEGIGKVLWNEEDNAVMELQELLERPKELERMEQNMAKIRSKFEGVWQAA